MFSSTAFCIILFSLVIALGLWLGKFSVKGITIGSTWILFIGILMGHLGYVPEDKVLSFMKDFGLILFVYSIGLQVGPGFFSSFKNGGIKMNVLASCLILLSVLTAFVIHIISGENLEVMVGVMSGAVTNTPGLGAAQQTLLDFGGGDTSKLASAYAVAYPIGVLGVLFFLVFFKAVFKIDLEKERVAMSSLNPDTESSARRMHCRVTNPGIFGLPIKKIVTGDMVISRMMRDGKEFVPDSATTLQEGDFLLIVTTQKHVDRIRMIIGEEVSMHLEDWTKKKEVPSVGRLTITNAKVTGKKLKEMMFRTLYGVTVTRIVRADIQLVATKDTRLQVGDYLQVVGPKDGIEKVSNIVGNKASALDKPNIIPIFIGIVLGVILGSLPITISGIPQPIKLGLAGGPLIVAILLSYFGPRLRLTTYTTHSANMMIREIGISFFLAAVGLGAGRTFVSSLMDGGWWWILYGAMITMIPVITIGFVARLIFKLNFYQICGLISGGTTNPPVLAFAQGAYNSDYTSVNYATVYPLSMFLRVLVAQVMILVALA